MIVRITREENVALVINFLRQLSAVRLRGLIECENCEKIIVIVVIEWRFVTVSGESQVENVV